MTSKEIRMNTMKNAGMNTGKYFSIQLPEGLAPGSTISLVINENDELTVNSNGSTVDVNPAYNQIIEDGYVRNTKLHRRWVMAQTFRMLNYTSYYGNKKGWTACLNNCYGYEYQFSMMLEEVRVLSKLEDRDKDSFLERVHFFDKNVVLATCNDYMKKLKEYVDTLQVKKCKGVPYKRIYGRNIFVADIPTKLYVPLANDIFMMHRKAKNYKDMYKYLSKFYEKMVKLPFDTKKCAEWVDAFKGAGAYYTLKNLIMFHNCDLIEQDGFISRSIAAEKRLYGYLDTYKGSYYKMHAMLKEVIKYNNFDFKQKMKEIYSNK